MGVKPIHQRLAELWTMKKQRKLTQAETKEMEHCLDANTKFCWEIAYLENMSILASMTNNVSWQHDVCAEIDQLMNGIEASNPDCSGTD